MLYETIDIIVLITRLKKICFVRFFNIMNKKLLKKLLNYYQAKVFEFVLIESIFFFFDYMNVSTFFDSLKKGINKIIRLI